ncbi:unnamed protein product [Symbiodinium necroappetens]|uniref:Pentatricopeptide repeat-containing protein, chloroplastic n=1 Tax=Symbiodinium necroappetens TaxID=1628268 RepID=A0A812UDB7_9DINO|nr:unnamed protein product [Symbiodinium necroappetens]
MHLLASAPCLDSKAFCIAIDACGRGSAWLKALRFFSLAISGPGGADRAILNAAGAACTRGGEWQRALHILLGTRMGAPCDTVTYGSAIAACSLGREWTLCLLLLREMSTSSLVASAACISAAVAACEKGSQWIQALSLLYAGSSSWNGASVGAAMATLCNTSQWEKSLHLLSSAADACFLDSPAISSTILACELALAWRAAFQLHDETLKAFKAGKGGQVLDTTALLAPTKCGLALSSGSQSSLQCVAGILRGALGGDAFVEQESTLTLLLQLSLLAKGSPLCRAFHRRVIAAARLELARHRPGVSTSVMLAALADLGPEYSREVLSWDLGESSTPSSGQQVAARAVSSSFLSESLALVSPVRPVARRLRAWLSAGLLHRGVGIEIQEVMLSGSDFKLRTSCSEPSS